MWGRSAVAGLSGTGGNPKPLAPASIRSSGRRKGHPCPYTRRFRDIVRKSLDAGRFVSQAKCGRHGPDDPDPAVKRACQ